MPTSERSTPAGTARALGMTLASASPLLAMLAAGTAYAPCAGGDRLTGAAFALVPGDAPGSPLAVLLVSALSWLPLGPLPLRFALATSALAAVAAAALYCAIDAGANATDAGANATDRRPARYVSAPLALGFVWFAFACDALFLTEAHAYVVSVAIACLTLGRLAAARAAADASGEARALRAAAFWLGLLIVEQPVLALCVGLAALPALRRARSAVRFHSVWPASAALSALALVALSARDPERAGSAVAAAARLCAQTFVLAGDRSLAARVAPLSAPAWPLLGIAALALLSALRRPQRSSAPAWSIATCSAFASGLLFADASALQALALCGAAAIGALALTDLLGGDHPRLGFAVAVLAIALAGAQLRATALTAMGRDGGAADVLREPLLRAVPPRATLLVDRDLGRTLRNADLEERVRPDVVFATKPWRLDLAASTALASSAPELQPAMRAYLLSGDLPLAELRSLAARRPLLVELSVAADERALVPALLPFGLYHQVSTSTTTRSDARFAAREAEARLAPLPALLEADAQGLCCRDLLLDRALAAADYYQQVGDPDRATSARAWAAPFADAETAPATTPSTTP